MLNRIIYGQICVLFIIITLVEANCPSNCSECNNPSICDTCDSGFYQNLDGSCPECPNPCTSCTLVSGNILCQTCNTKYYPSSNQCLQCPNECATCTSQTVCDACTAGYYLLSDQCPQCPTGCSDCTSNTNCSSCSPNYYLSSTSCLACPTICTTCSSPSVCSGCIDGYYLSGSTCIACQSPCAKCVNSSSQCTGCVPSFGLVGTTCQLCTQPCTSCENSITNCTVCTDSTNQLPPTCDCTSPAKYQHPTTYMCLDCQSPCLNCSSVSSCDSCIDTYLLISTVCIPCTQPCANCSGSVTTCSTCIDSTNQTPPLCQCNTGYIMNPSTYMCNQCTYPCATCQTTVSYCLTCVSTYTHNSTTHTCNCLTNQYQDNGSPNQCLNCQSTCLTCQTTSSNCTSCDNSLFRQLDNNQCVCEDGYYDIGTCQECTLPCNTCTSASICLTCNDLAKIPPDCICNNQQYFDILSNNCEFCQMPCLNCITTSQTCTSCLSNFYLSGNTCLQCSLPCQECINTDTQCTACVNSNSQVVNTTCICNNGYYMDIDYVCQKCDKFCQTCINNSTNCLICANTYILSISIPNKCECSQGYYQISSQNDCQQCPQICTKCQSYQFCTECSVGYYLESNSCQQCNDNCLTCINQQDYCQSCRINYELINNQCLCKSGYFEQNNECIKCNYPCQTCENNSTYCLSCDIQLYRQLINNQCLCINQYFELNNQCISCQSEQGKIQQNCQYKDCNDKQWTYGEQCDDGNNIIRDGCSNCQIDNNYSCFNELLQISICYQCSINCKQCQINQKIIECIQCQDEYFIDQYQCQKCSDKCIGCVDNSNNCIKCRFIQNNQTKQCQICEDQQGFYSDYINNKCYTKCGDSFKSINEECDDGNLLNGDGCDNQCKLEHKYICKDGICITPNYPIPKLTTIGDTSIYNNIRQFKLQYDQLLNITNEFNITNQISLFIVKDNQEQEIIYPFEITQNIKFEQIGAVTFSSSINLNLNSSSQNEFLLIKFLNNSFIISSEGYSQQVSNLTILIFEFKLIDQNTDAKVQAITETNTYILYILAIMAGGSILFGGIEIFYNLLDTIQMLSYLKYINLSMPYNLMTFFDIFGFAQLNIISKYLHLDNIIYPYIDYSQLKPLPGKIANDQLNSLFIINGASLLLIWISLIIIYSAATVLPRILNSYRPKYYSETPEEDVWLIRFRIYYLAIKIFLIELCNVIVAELFFSGILRVQISTAYDYCFSLFLQIQDLKLYSGNFLVVFSSYLALAAAFAYLYTVFVTLKVSNFYKYVLKNQDYRFKYGSIVEGVKLNRYCKYFNSILLIKKMIFMAILILGYYFPYFQAINMTLLSFIQSLFLIKFQPLDDSRELFKQIICETNTFITLALLVVLVIDDEINYLNYQDRFNIGWVCIMLLSSILVIQLIVDAIQQWQLLFQKFRAIKKLIKLIQNLFHSTPTNQAPLNILEPAGV